MIKFSNLRTRTKVVIGVCSPLALLLILSGVAIYDIDSITRTNKSVDHTRVALADASQIVGSAVDMETGMRGYLLAGQEQFLEPYDRGRNHVVERIAELQKTVSDNPRLVDRLAQAAKTLREWQTEVAEPAIALRREIGDAPTMNDMAKLVGEARGKTYFDRLRGQIATFIEREQDLLIERHAEFTKTIAGIQTARKQSRDATSWVNHTHEVLKRAANIVASAVDIETGMRGFLLAGKDSFLEPYDGGTSAFFAQISELQTIVNDNPPQVARLQEAADLIAAWMKEVTEPAIAARRDVLRGVTSMQDIVRSVGEGRGKAYFDAFRAKMAKFSDVETVLISERLGVAVETSDATRAAIETLQENERWVTHTHNVIAKAELILTSALDMETGMRGYLLAGKENFLEPYHQGSKSFTLLVDELSQTVNDNPSQVALLGEIKATLLTWQSDVAEPTIVLRRDIGDAKTMDDMADLIGEARGKIYFDGFRQIMTDFRGEELALMTQRKADNEQTVDRAYAILAGSTVVGVLVGLAFAWMIGGSIAKPIGQITGSMRRLASGDTSVEIVGAERRDEIGEIAQAVDVFKQNSIKLAEIGGDLESSVGNVVDTLLASSADLDRNADQLAATTKVTNSRGVAVAGATEEMSASIQTMAASAGQLSTAIAGIADQISRSSAMAKDASMKAGQAKTTAEALLLEADRVEAVVALISDIAEQTNLLALNATIEAARAGEMGKGFAVVASEVKSLASQTGTATGRISSQIKSIQSQCKEVANEVVDISDSIKTMDEITTMIAGSVEEQNAATAEIAAHTQESARTASEISANITDVQDHMADAERSGGELNQATEQVINQANQLRDQMAVFIKNLKSAA